MSDLLDIERAVIAALLIRAEAVLESPALSAEAFRDREHKAIFEAAARTAVANTGSDPLVICADAARALGLSEPPGLMYARHVTVTDEVIYSVTHGDLRAKMEHLAREHRRRQLQQHARGFLAALERQADPDEALAEHQAACDRAVGLRDWTTLEAEVERFLREKAGEPTPLGASIQIGYPSLGHVPFAPGRMIVLAGRPGSGKTTFATRIAVNVAARGFGVAYHAIEPTAEELTHKVLSQMSALSPEHLVHPKGREEEEALEYAAIRAGELPIAILPGASRLGHICAHTKRAVECSPWRDKRVALVIVDYAQLIEHRESKYSRRHEDLSAISRILTRMAKTLRVVLLVLVAMNRELERDNRKRSKRLPQLSDIAESGSFERDADAVVFLHRAEPESPVVQVVVGKNRHGPMRNATLGLALDRHDLIDPLNEPGQEVRA